MVVVGCSPGKCTNAEETCAWNRHLTCESPLGYTGSKSSTITGLTCQRWDSQTPHEHTRTSTLYPNADLSENYCRNPDGGGDGPYCYTTDSEHRWQYCFQTCSGGRYTAIEEFRAKSLSPSSIQVTPTVCLKELVSRAQARTGAKLSLCLEYG